MRSVTLSNDRLRRRSTGVGCGARSLDDPAELFHETSRYYPRCLERPPLVIGTAGSDGSGHLVPTRSRSFGKSVQLPRAEAPPMPLLQAIVARRSRQPAGAHLTLNAIATMLHAAYGITMHENPSHRRHSVPSAGGLYPLDWYLASVAVQDLPPGLYHYEPSLHSLESVLSNEAEISLDRAILTPGLVGGAAAVLILTAVFARSSRKYGVRAYRFVLMEAGHSMQNLLLMATCLGINATPIGGSLDAEVDRMLHVDGVSETTLYMAAAG